MLFYSETPLRELGYEDLQGIIWVDEKGANPRCANVECYSESEETDLFTIVIHDAGTVTRLEGINLDMSVDELVQLYSKVQEDKKN